MKLNCLIVDDEPMARKGIAEYVREIEFLALAGECSNAKEAEEALAHGGVDLILLDIQMPNMTGIEFLKTLPDPPMVIITTAYSEFALEGYALDVMDFLVKPIPFERFRKAVTKALDFHEMRIQSGKAAPDFFFVKSAGKYERILFRELDYVEAMQNYVILHLTDNKLIVYMTLSGLEKQLPADQFMRVHKSYLVALPSVSSVEANEVIVRKARIPVSRTLRDEVKKRVLGNNLLKR